MELVARQVVVMELDTPQAVAVLDAQQAAAVKPTSRQEAELKSALQSPGLRLSMGRRRLTGNWRLRFLRRQRRATRF